MLFLQLEIVSAPTENHIKKLLRVKSLQLYRGLQNRNPVLINRCLFLIAQGKLIYDGLIRIILVPVIFAQGI